MKKNILVLLGCLLPFFSFSQINAKLLRHPDVSNNQICFVYGGDVWIVSKNGGAAQHLSTPAGEELNPRFSPDGKQIAYTANYHGNSDVFIVNSLGGIPMQITHHPYGDRVVDWTPDGEKLLFASMRESGRRRFNQLYLVNVSGGYPEKLPLAYGEQGSYSPDGNSLAFTTKNLNRSMKRYRNGLSPDIWIYDKSSGVTERIEQTDANEAFPMWHGNKVYFISDREESQRFNIWSFDLTSKESKRITDFSDFDVKYPSIGPEDIVFEAGGDLYLLGLETEQYKKVDIHVVSDQTKLIPTLKKVDKMISNASLSPKANRVVMEARGELFSLPAKDGYIANLSQSSGSAERYPAWSPDGKYIAYWSDKNGEYNLYLKDMENPWQEDRKITNYTSGFYYNLYWSPDSKKIIFAANSQGVFLLDVATGNIKKIDQIEYGFSHFWALEFRVNWSSDSKWITYEKLVANENSAIFAYNLEADKVNQLTSGYYNDSSPVFDPDGKYLYFTTDREMKAIYSDLDDTWIYPNSTKIAAVPLSDTIASPLEAKNDKVEPKKKEDKEEKGDDDKKKNDKEDDKEGKEEDKTIHLQVDGFERRMVILPPAAGNIGNLTAVSGKLLFHRFPNRGSESKDKPIKYFDLKERKEETIIENADLFMVSSDHQKLLIRQNGKYGIIDVKSGQKLEDSIRTGEMEMSIDPKLEWKQIFDEVYRTFRDFFYDPKMHQIDWKRLHDQYSKILPDIITREDLNFLIWEIMSEIASGHTYVSGGDIERPKFVGVGMLGIDWELDGSNYKIKRIVKGAPWDHEIRSPLEETKSKVKEGDFILAVNGMEINIQNGPYAPFTGLGGKTVQLTVNKSPSFEGSENVTIKLLNDEGRLRHLEWIENNRKYVEKASDGKIGYIYMQNTGSLGQSELVRQFYAQIDKDAFVIDERFNSGGQLAGRFIELLTRKNILHIYQRTDKIYSYPSKANDGPKVMLINGWSGSGGDAFPWAFKEMKVGPIVGDNTYGILVGPVSPHSLIDGGMVSSPGGRLFGNNGEWFWEGVGVTPDHRVVNNPGTLSNGKDEQMDKAIEILKELLEQKGDDEITRPEFEDRRKVKK